MVNRLKKKSLQRDRKLNYLFENTGWASLIYLILPTYKCVMDPVNWETGALSIVLVCLAFLRCFWGPLFKKSNSKIYEFGLYLITGLLTISSSILASGVLYHTSFEVVVLFDTVFVATMATGVMTAFSVVPIAAAIFGGFALFPFSIVLILNQPTNSLWLLLGAMVCHLWNMNQVNRTYKNFLKIQDSEETIKFQEQRLKDFIDTLPGFISWFDNDLKYLDANEKLVELCGLNKEELIGKSIGFQNKNNLFIQKVQEFKNSSLQSDIVEILLLIEGQDKYLLTNLLKYHLPNGDEQLSVLSLDMTSVKVKEFELEKRRQQLMTQEKFTALGEMAGGIAHEINNPLTIICGKAELLLRHKQRGVLTEEALEKHLTGINETSLRIISIVKSLKTLVRDGRIENLVNITIGDAIEPLLELLYSRLENMNVKLIVEKEGFNLSVYCGVVELGQVLMNLVVNAAQAVAELPERWVKLQVLSENSKTLIYISDSGKELSKEVQAKLFQPFFTTKAPGVGTGMGLSLSRELMQKQQGNLYFKKESENTTFVVELSNKKSA